MSYMDIKPGRHKATAVRARMGITDNKGTPFIEVEFHLTDVNETLRWSGYLTEKTIEKTLETMALLEWNDDETFQDGCINTTKEVSLVVELEPGQNGKEYPRVRWVNDANKRSFEGIDPSVMKSKLGGINLRAEMVAARKRLGMKEAPKNHAPGADKDPIPF